MSSLENWGGGLNDVHGIDSKAVLYLFYGNNNGSVLEMILVACAH